MCDRYYCDQCRVLRDDENVNISNIVIMENDQILDQIPITGEVIEIWYGPTESLQSHWHYAVRPDQVHAIIRKLVRDRMKFFRFKNISWVEFRRQKVDDFVSRKEAYLIDLTNW